MKGFIRQLVTNSLNSSGAIMPRQKATFENFSGMYSGKGNLREQMNRGENKESDYGIDNANSARGPVSTNPFQSSPANQKTAVNEKNGKVSDNEAEGERGAIAPSLPFNDLTQLRPIAKASFEVKLPDHPSNGQPDYSGNPVSNAIPPYPTSKAKERGSVALNSKANGQSNRMSAPLFSPNARSFEDQADTKAENGNFEMRNLGTEGAENQKNLQAWLNNNVEMEKAGLLDTTVNFNADFFNGMSQLYRNELKDHQENGKQHLPSVKINIGRIDVRAVTPVTPTRETSRSKPGMSLDDFLKKKNEGK